MKKEHQLDLGQFAEIDFKYTIEMAGSYGEGEHKTLNLVIDLTKQTVKFEVLRDRKVWFRFDAFENSGFNDGLEKAIAAYNTLYQEK